MSPGLIDYNVIPHQNIPFHHNDAPPLSYGSESYSVFYKNAKSLHTYKCGHGNNLIFPLSVDLTTFYKVSCLFIASYKLFA
jgi:hypothetical protein